MVCLGTCFFLSLCWVVRLSLGREIFSGSRFLFNLQAACSGLFVWVLEVSIPFKSGTGTKRQQNSRHCCIGNYRPYHNSITATIATIVAAIATIATIIATY